MVLVMRELVSFKSSEVCQGFRCRRQHFPRRWDIPLCAWLKASDNEQSKESSSDQKGTLDRRMELTHAKPPYRPESSGGEAGCDWRSQLTL